MKNEGMLVPVREVARLLSVSESHIRNLVSRNELPSVRVGRRRLFRRVDIERLISGGTTDAMKSHPGRTASEQGALVRPASRPPSVTKAK